MADHLDLLALWLREEAVAAGDLPRDYVVWSEQLFHSGKIRGYPVAGTSPGAGWLRQMVVKFWKRAGADRRRVL